MPQIRKFIDIDALPERVFAKATDPSLQPTWMTFLKEIEIISGDGKSAGTKDRSVMKLGPVPQSNEGEWIEYREPQAFARNMRGGLQMESRMSFNPTAGGTHVEWQIRYKPPLGLIGMAGDILFMNRVFQNYVEDPLELLKAQLEP